MFRAYITKKLTLEHKYKIKRLLGQDRYFDWTEVSSQISEPLPGGAKVAFLTSSGAHRAGNLLEPSLALSLKRRGAQTSVLLCDGDLPACNITEYGNQSSRIDTFLTKGPQGTKTCDGCFSIGNNTWRTTRVPVYLFSQFFSDSELVALPNGFELDRYHVYKGVEVGEHVVSASLRFLCRGSFDWSAPETRMVILRYLNAARRTVDVTQQFFDNFLPDVIVCFHGIYVPHGVFGAVARNRGIRIVNWNTSYRKRRVLVSRDDTYHKAMCSEPEAKWNVPLHDDQERRILEYLTSREEGSQDWQQFNDNPNKEVLSDKRLQVFIETYPKRFLLLPNVIWDAQLQYDPSIFPTMGEWVVETIRLFNEIPGRGLIVRIHPAEVRRYSPTREPLREVIEEAFPKGVPPNVHIIDASEDHSTYRLAELSQAAIIYGTKTGLELSARSVPVIVCGEAWIKDKGISFDPSSKEEYADMLRAEQLEMTEEMIRRARRFAYHFFERAALELPFLKSTKGDIVLEIDPLGLDAITKGTDKNLEMICAEIENETGVFIGGIPK